MKRILGIAMVLGLVGALTIRMSPKWSKNERISWLGPKLLSSLLIFQKTQCSLSNNEPSKETALFVAQMCLPFCT